MSAYNPPKWANRLLEKICPEELLEEIQGDLLEALEWRAEEKSQSYARRKFCLEVLMVFRFYKPKIMKANTTPLFKNYLLSGIRNLKKNKSHVVINTLGLGIALACCISAYLWVAYNIEFDNFHANEKVDKIYSVHSHYIKNDGTRYESVSAPINLGPNAAIDFASVKRFTRFNNERGYVRYGDNSFSEVVSFADSAFFEMFDFPLTRGNHDSFKNLHSAFLSEEMAKKYFRDQNPIGQTLKLIFRNQKRIQVTIDGVVKKVPVNNTFNFGILVREEHFMDIHNLGSDDWKDWRDPSTFIEVSSHEQVLSINEQIGKYTERRNKEKTDRVVESYRLEHFKSPYTQDDVQWRTVNMRISIVPLIVFISMALIILLIACFNLTNTSIAMTAKRMKEVGIRKVIGATKWHIVSQFLLETTLITFGSLVVGLAMSSIIVPAFADMWQMSYGLEDMSLVNITLTLLSLIFFTSMLAGIYPALFSTKFEPVILLKGKIRIKGSNFLSKSLISVQFALSVIVLVAGVIFIQNTKYQEQVDFGYDQDQVLLVQLTSQQEYEVMENRLLGHTKIQQLGGTTHSLGWDTYNVPVGVDTALHEVWHYGVGRNYFEVMGLHAVEGRVLNLESASDIEGAAVVNEAFVRKIKLEDPLSKTVTVHEVKKRVVGVVEDHLDNLFSTKEPEPAVFYAARPNQYSYLLVRAEPSDLVPLRDEIEEIWKVEFPDLPFQYFFQEDLLLDNMRNTNANLRTIFLFLTALGGLLSVSGIFSLATLNTERRSKEIGIRKALGATIESIIALMNKEFVIILTAAGLFGALGGYYLINMLLGQIYAYYMPVNVVSVILCASFIFAVGLATTSITILKGARANPADTLRTE